MRVLMIDGHPDKGRLSSHLLDLYASALPPDAVVSRFALAELEFDPVLRHGYARRTEWEPDLRRLAEALDSCDHLVIAFPMWWGAEPAVLKGLLDRLLLPGFAFAYHADDPWWDRYMAGRSADAIVTMDTPPLFLRFGYGNAVVTRWKRQVLDFCGFRPARVLALGPVKGVAERSLPKWQPRIERLARSVRQKEPDKKVPRLSAFLDRPVSPKPDTPA